MHSNNKSYVIVLHGGEVPMANNEASTVLYPPDRVHFLPIIIVTYDISALMLYKKWRVIKASDM